MPPNRVSMTVFNRGFDRLDIPPAPNPLVLRYCDEFYFTLLESTELRQGFRAMVKEALEYAALLDGTGDGSQDLTAADRDMIQGKLNDLHAGVAAIHDYAHILKLGSLN